MLNLTLLSLTSAKLSLSPIISSSVSLKASKLQFSKQISPFLLLNKRANFRISKSTFEKYTSSVVQANFEGSIIDTEQKCPNDPGSPPCSFVDAYFKEITGTGAVIITQKDILVNNSFFQKCINNFIVNQVGGNLDFNANCFLDCKTDSFISSGLESSKIKYSQNAIYTAEPTTKTDEVSGKTLFTYAGASTVTYSNFTESFGTGLKYNTQINSMPTNLQYVSFFNSTCKEIFSGARSVVTIDNMFIHNATFVGKQFILMLSNQSTIKNVFMTSCKGDAKGNYFVVNDNPSDQGTVKVSENINADAKTLETVIFIKKNVIVDFWDDYAKHTIHQGLTLILQCKVWAPMRTPFMTPYRTPFSSPFSSPFRTPFRTPFSSPFSTPYRTPDVSPMRTPYRTPEASPMRTVSPTPIISLKAGITAGVSVSAAAISIIGGVVVWAILYPVFYRRRYRFLHIEV